MCMHVGGTLSGAVGFRSLIILALGLSAVACDQPSREPTAPPSVDAQAPALRSVAVTGSRFRRADEDRFVAIARDVPAFAGYYVDAQHNIVAYVRDSAQFEPARTALVRRLASDRLGLPAAFQAGRIVVRKADYTFQQLSDWRDLATEQILGSIDGVVYDDLDSGNPALSWTVPTVTNGNSANTHYYLYSSVYYSDGSFDPETAIGSYYGGTTYLDLSKTVTSYNGTSHPLHGNAVSYRVAAYNAGVTRTSARVYYVMP